MSALDLLYGLPLVVRDVPLSAPPFAQLPDSSPLNLFYQINEGAEGWLGQSYISFLPLSEVRPAEEPRWQNLLIFASNGAGEFFAARTTAAEFVVTPAIGASEDAIMLGDWPNFIARLRAGDYLS